MTTSGRTDDARGDGVGTLGHLLAETTDRLRRLPESRLNHVAPAGRALAQALADAAAGIEQRDAPAPPTERTVPALSVFAVADQVAVTAHDLRAAAAGLEPQAQVWWHGDRTALQEVLTAVHDQAERVRAQT